MLRCRSNSDFYKMESATPRVITSYIPNSKLGDAHNCENQLMSTCLPFTSCTQSMQ